MQASDVFQEAFSGSVKQLIEEAVPIMAAVVRELADRCAGGLSQLRGITAMYRMSARPAPTRYAPLSQHWGSSAFTHQVDPLLDQVIACFSFSAKRQVDPATVKTLTGSGAMPLSIPPSMEY